jgi:hypothetical protein
MACQTCKGRAITLELNDFDKMTIEEKVELFFYNPYQDRDTYIKRYKELNPEQVKLDGGGYRYSPVYLMQKDNHYCYAIGNEFNSCRNNLHPAIFSGFILSSTCLVTVVSRLFGKSEKAMSNFANTYLKVDASHVIPLKELRNAFLHNFYSLSTKHRGTNTEFRYVLGEHFQEVISEQASKEANVRIFLINPQQFSLFVENALSRLKDDLYNPKRHLLRDNFEKSFNLGSWVLIRES